MPDARHVKQIVEDLEMLRKIDLSSLDHFPRPGSPTFADFRVLIPYLRLMQETTAAITHETLYQFSDSTIAPIMNPLSRFAKAISSAAAFQVGSYGDPNHESLNLIKQVQNAYEEMAAHMRTVTDIATASVPISERPELVALREVIEETKKTAKDAEKSLVGANDDRLAIMATIEAAKKRLDQLLDTAREDQATIAKEQRHQVNELIQGLESEIDERLEVTRKAVAEIAVSQQANHFDGEAKIHSSAAGWWLFWTILSVFLFLIVAVPGSFEAIISRTSPSTFDALVSPSAAAQNVLGVPLPYLLSKLVTLGALSFLIGICAKNFLSHRHNNVLNRHRTNALMTFEALAKSAVSESSRDVILHHAASCIFNPQDTGFGKVGEAGPGINIVEAAYRTADSPKLGSS